MIKIITNETIEFYDGTNWIKVKEYKYDLNTYEYYNTVLANTKFEDFLQQTELPRKLTISTPFSINRITYTFSFTKSDSRIISKDFIFLKGRTLAFLHFIEYYERQLDETNANSFLDYKQPDYFAEKILYNTERVFYETFGEQYTRKMGNTEQVLEKYKEVGESLINQYIMAFEISKGLGINNVFIA